MLNSKAKNNKFKQNYLYNIYIDCFLNDKRKEKSQKVWSRNLVHEINFQLSSRTPYLILLS